ncbi:MAG: hypothetical protein E7188_08115 [Erysipelotrichaceae bacterium]|nr:hypothetical protein [Erysipelotrichaceae bacterium]
MSGKTKDGWLKESAFIYCAVYTIVTVLNSVLYLAQGYRNDPSGNWHELTRAVIVLIGVAAYEMANRLPVKNVLLRSVLIYVPTMGLAFGFVWLNQFIEPLAESAYRDIFINYTGLFIVVSAIAMIGSHIRKKKNPDQPVDQS